MVIYHGSNIAVKEPKILAANRFLDFGEGFYTTSSYEQAKRWTEIVSRIKKTEQRIICTYNFDIEKAVKELNIIKFEEPSPEWLDFVFACRSGKEAGYKYDLAMGPVANDNVYAAVKLFETGVLTVSETIIRLKIEKIYNQILFHTNHALEYCKYENMKTLGMFLMDKEKFGAILPIFIADLVKKIMEQKNLQQDDAIALLYNSNLYDLLEDEQTKIWHYSTDKLFLLFEEEMSTGKIEFSD